MRRVSELLAARRQDLVNLAEALLEHEVLEAGEVRLALQGELKGSTRKSRSFLRSRALKDDLKDDLKGDLKDEAAPEANPDEAA
jgi:hypothetical protein